MSDMQKGREEWRRRHPKPDPQTPEDLPADQPSGVERGRVVYLARRRGNKAAREALVRWEGGTEADNVRIGHQGTDPDNAA